jgi:hypothetical protein
MAQNSLLSPGIQVSVIDESNYAVNSEGTIPFILMATAQDKTNPSGSLATGTAKANAGQVYSIGDQRTLANLFGLPQFPNDASGKRITNPYLANRKYDSLNYHKPCFFACVNSDLSRTMDKIYGIANKNNFGFF